MIKKNVVAIIGCPMVGRIALMVAQLCEESSKGSVLLVADQKNGTKVFDVPPTPITNPYKGLELFDKPTNRRERRKAEREAKKLKKK